MEWWSNNQTWETSLEEKQVTHKVYTDASESGYGVKCGNERFAVAWSENEQAHIGELELRTIWLALKRMETDLRSVNIRLGVDNKVALFCVNRKGGRIQTLDGLARNIWVFLEQRGSSVVAFYVPSQFNPADSLSR